MRFNPRVLLATVSATIAILCASVTSFANTLGDVDGNGAVEIADARKTLRASVYLEALSDEEFTAADYNMDSKVTASDARHILIAAISNKTLTAVELTSKPAVDYYVGDTLSVSGGVLTLTYSDGSEVTVDLTADMVSGFDSSSAGTKTLTVSYGGFTDTYTVTVSEDSGTDTYENGYNMNYICGVDMFGRVIEPVSGFDESKDVGIFYFVWTTTASDATGTMDVGQNSSTNPTGSVRNITEIINAGNINELFSTTSTISPMNVYHYWGKPLYGYYESSEVFVIRRHIELLTSAGIDFIIIDTTNGLTYDTVVTQLLNQWKIYQSAGWDVPKIAFYTNTSAATTMTYLYNKYYTGTTYKDLWYAPEGKPLMIGTTSVSDTMTSALDIRNSYWPQAGMYGSLSSSDYYGWPWIEWVFKPYNHNGVVSVSVAQHPNGRFSDNEYNPTYTGSTPNWGRGANNFTGSNYYKATSFDRNNGNDATVSGAKSFWRGQNIQHQWQNAVSQGASTIFVTGWNEWIAMKHTYSGSKIAYVDCFNTEYSRDIEPVTGEYGDSYYMQLIKNIRDYKGLTGRMSRSVSKTIDITAGESEWTNVTNIYRSIKGLGTNAKYNRAGAPVATDSTMAETGTVYSTTVRNALLSAQVTHDSEYLYFRIATYGNIYTKSSSSQSYFTDGKVFNILIGIGDVELTGWEGYEYVINRDNVTITNATANGVGNGTSSVCPLNTDGTSGTASGTAEYVVDGKCINVKIPLSALGITDTAQVDGIYFKVADCIGDYTDISDYYVDGASLPLGRLSYYYYFN